MNLRGVGFFRLSYALQKHHKRAPDCGHVDRLKCCVQNEHRFLHYRGAAMLAGCQTRGRFGHNRATSGGAPGTMDSLASGAHGPSTPGCSRKSSVAIQLGTERATVKALTRAAPALRNALEQASSVAPVVITSSTSRMCRLSTRMPSRAT